MLRKMQHAIFSVWENNLPERRMRAESFIAYAAGWLRESKKIHNHRLEAKILFGFSLHFLRSRLTKRGEYAIIIETPMRRNCEGGTELWQSNFLTN